METILEINPAEALYRTMHNSHLGYRNNNQGLWLICDWLNLLRDSRGEIHNPWTDKPITIVELGCGNGKLCDLLSEMKLDVTGVDIALAPTVYDRSKYKFIKHDLTVFPYPFSDNEFDYCLSFDVLEHLPEKNLPDALREMARISKGIIVKIACSGQPPLHLTVKSPGWWLNQLIINCPDLSWRLIRNYERIQTVVDGNICCFDQATDIRPFKEGELPVYAPLFYGRKGVVDEG